MTIESSVVFFPVRDINKTDDFYIHKIGLKSYMVQTSDTSECHIYDTGYGYIGFCQYNDGRTIHGGLCISFNCSCIEDVDAQYKRIKAMDIPVVQPPQYHDHFPVYSCFFKDPDGYIIEFQKIIN